MQSSGEEVRALSVEETTAMLRDLILAGSLAAGARLGEAELADRLDVSRTPVREALSRLAAEGLVEIVPNRGARVANWTTTIWRDLRAAAAIGAVRGRPGRPAADGADSTNSRRWPAGCSARKARPRTGSRRDRAPEPAVPRHADRPRGRTRRWRRHCWRSPMRPWSTRTSTTTPRRRLPGAWPTTSRSSRPRRAGNADWANSVMRSHLYNARATMLPAARPIRRETP